jgi:hypothetical protein
VDYKFCTQYLFISAGIAFRDVDPEEYLGVFSLAVVPQNMYEQFFPILLNSKNLSCDGGTVTLKKIIRYRACWHHNLIGPSIVLPYAFYL